MKFSPQNFQTDGVNLWYFKLRLFDLTEFIVQSELLEGGAAPLWYEIKASGMKDTTKIELNKGPEIPVKIVSYLII